MFKMRKMQIRTALIVVAALAMILPSFFAPGQVLASGATAPPLLTAQNFGILGASTVTNTGPSVITNGDLGVWPGSAITGFPPGTIAPPGIKHVTDGPAQQAQTDALAAYVNLAAQTPFVNLTGQDLGLVSTPLTPLIPGVYHFDTSAQLTGTLTLDALNDPNSVFIFQIGTALTTASNSKVVVLNAPPNWCNKFWQIGSSATLGTNTAFVGTIIADQSITLNTGASLLGRAIALNGAVTMDTNAITVPSCGAHLSLTKTVDPATYTTGDTLTYTLVATNDGNVPLTDVAISDPGLLVTDSGGQPLATLAVSSNLTVTGNRTIGPGDISRGFVTNNATAAGTPPTGETVTSNASVTAFVTVEGPHLSLTKTVNPATYSNVGDILNYTLVAINDGTGNLNNVSISDPNITLTGPQPTTLGQGDTLTVTGNRTITQTDLNNGSLSNNATAVYTPEEASQLSVSANATATALQVPLLLLTKTVNPATYSQVGDKLTFTITATNIGNVTLTGVSVSDPGLDNILPNPPEVATLAPLATFTVTGTHAITLGDLNAGHYNNTATAAGTSPALAPVSATISKQTSRAASVGGEVDTINRASVLAPWLGLGLLLVIGGTLLTVIWLRRRTSR